MNNIYKVARYFLRDSKMALAIFYMIFLTLSVLLMLNTNRLNEQPNVEASFGGFGFAAVIFLFISGLNSFRIVFKFMQANNVSRIDLFFGGITAFMIISGFMAIIEIIMNRVFMAVSSYQNLYEQLYKNDQIIAEFLWVFALYIFAISLGWLITMLYYKCDKLMKTLISLIPAIIIILLITLNNLTEGEIGNAIVGFFSKALGFTDGYNSYIAVLSFITATIIAYILSFLLIRKMPLKE